MAVIIARDKAQAVHNFWSSFNVPAWDENTPQSDYKPMHITYTVSTAEMGSAVILTASIWDYSTSWAAISQKADEIGRALGLGGMKVPYTGGQLWMKRGTPFAQRMADPDYMIRRIVLNIEAEFLSED